REDSLRGRGPARRRILGGQAEASIHGSIPTRCLERFAYFLELLEVWTPDEIGRHVVGNHDVDPDSAVAVRIFPKLGSEFGYVKPLEDRIARQRGKGPPDIVRGKAGHVATLPDRGSRIKITPRNRSLSAPDHGGRCNDQG